MERGRGGDMLEGVKVLKNWEQIGEAILFLSEGGHRSHPNPIKNWDLRLIREFFGDLGRDELVVDLGASPLAGVRLCHEMGFRKVIGYDLKFSIFDRVLQLRDWIGLKSRLPCPRPTLVPYRLRTRDLMRNGLPNGCAGGVICLSVIEHGVDVERFFPEVARILRPGGRLYVSTDYWDPKLDTGNRRMFGQPWTIFASKEIVAMIEAAEKVGLTVNGWGQEDLLCENAPVRDHSHTYTFIAVLFRKS